MGANWAIDAQGLGRRYGASWALAKVDLQVAPGEALLLTGHNGSGKTTLLRVLATALAPSLGALRILGHDARAQREQVRPRVALLTHAHALYDDLTGRQNAMLLAQLLGKGAREVDALLERVRLTAHAGLGVRYYSAGMKKRLALCRLLLKAPELALLDEPFGELDPEGIALMEGVIRELTARGTTLVLSTHLVAQGLTLTTRRLHLERGRPGAPAEAA